MLDIISRWIYKEAKNEILVSNADTASPQLDVSIPHKTIEQYHTDINWGTGRGGMSNGVRWRVSVEGHVLVSPIDAGIPYVVRQLAVAEKGAKVSLVYKPHVTILGQKITRSDDQMSYVTPIQDNDAKRATTLLQEKGYTVWPDMSKVGSKYVWRTDTFSKDI
jgi:hypothetical protein